MINIEFTNNTSNINFKGGIENIASLAYVVIDKQTHNRIDLVSMLAYNSINEIHKIMLCNEMRDSMYMPSGMVLKVPNMDSFAENVEYRELLRCDIENVTNVNTGTRTDTKLAPNVKKSVRKNYTTNGDGVFIF